MKIESELVEGRLIRRYKRFLADVELSNGEIVVAHCTNSGSMKSCLENGAPVIISKSDNPLRKTKFTWEYIQIDGNWIGVNTMLPNNLVYYALKNNLIHKLSGYQEIKREITVLDSRIDFFLESENNGCFVEVKNVSLREGEYARFPDSITKRGTKHLKTLMELKKQGFRTAMIYIIQREDIFRFGPAWDIDPTYSKTLVTAYNKGVEIIPIMIKFQNKKIELVGEIKLDLNDKRN